MKSSEMTIQFNGFHPSTFTQDYLGEMMDELYTESPHGASLQAVFSRQNHLFKARVKINSSGGHFFAVASGRHLKDVTHRITHQIRKQLGKWKKQHHRHQTIRHLEELPESLAESFKMPEQSFA